MKKIMATFLILVAGLSLYLFIPQENETSTPRGPASGPKNYDSLSACEKQEVLWKDVQSSVHQDLPEYEKFGFIQLVKMGMQAVQRKAEHSDFAPQGWKKYIHRRGSMAKVKIVPVSDKYTGLFQGADCALLRLSLTYRVTGKRPVAPGLALKILRDGIPSANISALVSLSGQEKDFNFFKNPMSNIVPVGHEIGQKLVHRIFRKASSYPEELLVDEMAQADVQGQKIQDPKSPRQIFFVPGESLQFSSDEHDVRKDFASIPEGSTVYKIFALSDKYKDFDYAQYSPEKAQEFMKESEHIADIISTSEFLASSFGDDGIFFRHQMRP